MIQICTIHCFLNGSVRVRLYISSIVVLVAGFKDTTKPSSKYKHLSSFFFSCMPTVLESWIKLFDSSFQSAITLKLTVYTNNIYFLITMAPVKGWDIRQEVKSQFLKLTC